MNTQVTSIEEIQEQVCASRRVLARGGGSKPALSTPVEDVTLLDMSGLSGMREYEAQEFTFTALAGTRLVDVQEVLAQNGQHLPFDPPLAEHGATLGGTVAAGLSGPGRYQSGGVRDFLLGVRFLDGLGRLVRGGGKVVKNAAGFDFPKLMVGSLGQFGVLVELTFKVFPKPEAYATLRLEYPQIEAALQGLYRLSSSPLEINAIDIQLEGTGAVLWTRLAGLASSMAPRLERLRSLLGGGDAIQGEAEEGLWRAVREMEWVPDGWSLVKVPLTPRRIPTLEARLAERESLRRYSGGGQLAWIALPDFPVQLEALLLEQSLSGLVIFGPPGRPLLGASTGASFARRVKTALDPDHRFEEA